jgi:hypothetical protein
MWYALEREEMGTILVGKREEKGPHGRPRQKCEYKMGLK